MPKKPRMITIEHQFDLNALHKRVHLCPDAQFTLFADAFTYVQTHDDTPTYLHQEIRDLLTQVTQGRYSFDLFGFYLQEVSECAHRMVNNSMASGKLVHYMAPNKTTEVHPWIEEYVAHLGNLTGIESSEMPMLDLEKLMQLPQKQRLKYMEDWTIETWESVAFALDATGQPQPEVDITLEIHFQPRLVLTVNHPSRNDAMFRLTIYEDRTLHDIRGMFKMELEWNTNTGKPSPDFGIPFRIGEANRIDENLMVSEPTDLPHYLLDIYLSEPALEDA